MRKKCYSALCVLMIIIFVLVGCIPGELLNAAEFLEITEINQYIEFDPEETLNWWEKEEPASKPTIEALEGSNMVMRTYYKILFKYKQNSKNAEITCIKLDVKADKDCVLNIVIRDEDNRNKEPIFEKTFNLKEFESQSIIVADFVFAKGDILCFYNECPEDIDVTEYSGFFAKWRIEYLQVVGELI